MSQHQLQGRSDAEVLWFQRRSFIKAAAAWTAMGGFAIAYAQQRGNIVELFGDALLNGQRLTPQQTIQTGDSIETGPRSQLIFVIGRVSFHMRQNSRLTVERGATWRTVSLLRVIHGGVISVWDQTVSSRIVTPTLTANIRAAGVYTEVFEKRQQRSYLCNCYGTVELATASDKTVSTSVYHDAYWADPPDSDAGSLTPARAINHTDLELEFLARLIQQKTAWQISGKKETNGTSDWTSGGFNGKLD